ncbi:MAG TPA: ATP-binding protein, partial [Magnetospirillum sp.]|nr:ATP-binding protein [Magnetospirillum sp.]
IGQDGSILARAPNQVSEFGRNIGDSDLIRIWAPRSPVGVAHLVAKTDGNDKLLAYRVMPEFGLMVSAGVSRSRALADWHRMVLAELTLLTAFSGMLLYWTRRIKRHDEEQAQIEQELERAVETRTDELKAARMLAEQRAVQLGWINAELRRLAQVASHHLQEPLRAIVSCGQMVRRSLPQPIAGLDDAVEGMCYEGIALKTHLGDFEKHVSTISDAAVDDDPCAAGPPEERAPPSPSLGSHSFKARAVAATIILVVLAGHGLQLRADYRNAIVASERLTGAVVNTIEHHLRSSFRRVDNLLNDVTLAVEDDRHQSQAFHERMLARLTTVPEVRYVSVADAEGRVSPHTWPAHALSPQDRNVAGRDFFRGQRASAMHGNLVIGQPRLDPATGERELVFSQPVVGPTGRFAGIVFASVDPDLYARFLDTVLLDEDGGTAVIALDGHMVARAPKHEEKFALDISGSDLFTQYLPNGPSGTAHLVSKTDGNRKLLGYQVVDDFPLVVTSGYSIDKALGEWNLIAVSTTAMAVIASAILFAWAWRADRHARNQFHYRHDLAAQVALRTAGLAAAHQAAEARSNSLAEANARLEDLSRIITADMRAPLRALTDHIATVERLAGGRTEECDHWLAFISAGGIHLKALLRDYQRFVSALSGAPRLRDVDCDEIVRGAARLVESMWKDKVRFSVAPLPHVHGDRDMLLEVFLQLFSNAAIHSKDAQQVTVTVRADRQGDEWRISVADDGPGLPPVNPEHLFRAFETAHNRDPDSTGLGLPLCRIIIQCHDGRIWATSRRGKGTEFHFTLPAAPALATPREAA